MTNLGDLLGNMADKCSKIIVAKRSKFNKSTYRGEISDTEMMELIINTVKESPTVNKKQLREFGII